MRLHCNLREFRGKRVLRELAEEAGISAGVLSMIERGHTLPMDADVPTLERVYGCTRTAWYDPGALLAIQRDQERTA